LDHDLFISKSHLGIVFDLSEKLCSLKQIYDEILNQTFLLHIPYSIPENAPIHPLSKDSHISTGVNSLNNHTFNKFFFFG